MAYCCCSGLRGNLDFPDFLQKKFYNIYYSIIDNILDRVKVHQIIHLILVEGQYYSSEVVFAGPTKLGTQTFINQSHP